MSGYRHILLRFCLVIALAVILYLPGCRKEEPAVYDSTPDEPAEPAVKKVEYANDLDRLGLLTERLNRACRKSYVVVLGVEGSVEGGGPVSVDYALFDKLSDDGAAVLIAEAIAARSRPSSQAPVQTDVSRVTLQADESVGRYIAGAGFSPDGFTEWLRAKDVSAVGPEQNSVPDEMRIAAFMRGYSSERYSKKER